MTIILLGTVLGLNVMNKFCNDLISHEISDIHGKLFHIIVCGFSYNLAKDWSMFGATNDLLMFNVRKCQKVAVVLSATSLMVTCNAALHYTKHGFSFYVTARIHLIHF